MVRILLEAGADQTIRDATHDSDALGWAEYSKQEEMVRILQAARNPAEGRDRPGDSA
jgi:hypothetical protein